MVLALFLLAAVVQLAYWLFVLASAYRPKAQRKVDSLDQPAPVSVIVCFRNEAATLARLVNKILAQQYAVEFELVLVDDNSTDDSVAAIQPFLSSDPRVRLVTPGPTRPGKKDALSFGIQSARHDHLLLTDADCVPASPDWLRSMTQPLRDGKELTLGVSPYLASKSLLSRWQQFESVYVSLKYLGFARRGLPYMGVGRNLAYTRSFFERSGGFTSHADVASGDDDLLVSGNAEASSTASVTTAAAWAFSHPQPTWSAYLKQRARHQSTGVRYPKGVAAALTLLAASHGFFYLLGVAAILQGHAWPVLTLYLLRLIVQVFAYASPFQQLRQADHSGAAAGAEQGPSNWIGLISWVAFFDAWVGPAYLYLALAGGVGRKEW
ncbi:glycosyltransferase [Lewinella sp. 4G2]|uniref:glycosyltransferase n=1 Tax=Lewinella sp. 4G2 TaxID=1803372 RepID=UPI0007B4780D|nr:glycosyltransferase [Lewinella sp. 4G2]OAV43244.1 hypothetical protein A3850_001465 [Lewinella sp. 4G2]